MNPSPIVRITDLSYHYPDGRQALSRVSLEMDDGEKVALVGRNGAGKSTLLLHLNGILQGDGQVEICGMRLAPATLPEVRARVGLVFQNPDDQLFSQSVFDDVAYGLVYQKMPRDVIHNKVEQALAAVHMEGYAKRMPHHLSTGEKKRIAIASVLSMQPSLLVFDEPTAGLDPRARRELIELLRELPQTMLIATHDLDMVASLATRVLVMQDGSIQAQGHPADILGSQSLLQDYGLY